MLVHALVCSCLHQVQQIRHPHHEQNECKNLEADIVRVAKKEVQVVDVACTHRHSCNGAFYLEMLGVQSTRLCEHEHRRETWQTELLH